MPPRFASRAQVLVSSEIREILKVVENPSIISFAGGTPEPDAFPFTRLASASNNLLSNGATRKSALQYSISEGNNDLRRWLQRYMRQRGVEVGLTNILITSGAQQGIDLLARLFLDSGDLLAVSNPTYLGALQVFSGYSPNYHTVDTDSLGSLPESVREAFTAHPKFFYVVPDYLNPTGISHTLERRQNIVDSARQCDVMIIEDAAYEQLHFDGPELPPLISLDARMGVQGESDPLENGRVVYLGTFSKTVVPGFRLGWAVGPAEIIRRLTLLKQAADLHSNTFGQYLLSLTLDEFSTHVAALRTLYRKRRDCMLAAIESEFPKGASWTRPAGGFFIWAELQGVVDTKLLLERAIHEAGVAFVPGHPFFVENASRNFIRLSFSASNEERIQEGIRRLGRLIT